MKACVLRIEGTNCEEEMRQAFEEVGISAELVHLKQLTRDAPAEKQRMLQDYQILMIPGGWSAGDYVRAGAIFAARMKSRLRNEIIEFVDDGFLVGGVCNGFQVLVELGLLPAMSGKTMSDVPEAALTTNLNANFQCRPIYLKHVGKCAFTGRIPIGKVLQFPVAHAEGRFTFGGRNREHLKRLIDGRQIVFRYCTSDGEEAKGKFPWNPNGSLYDIAGICNPKGNVLGMMPHPERVVHKIQEAEWTRSRKKNKSAGDGRMFFESIAGYMREHL